MVYTSNISAVVNKLQNGLKGIVDRKLLIEIANDVYVSNIERIHKEGKAVAGDNIGQYNTTKSLYVNPANSPRGFAPEGKPKSQGKYKSGIRKGQDILKGNKKRTFKKSGELFAVETKHVTKYFPNYKAYRNTVGRRIDKVNLNLSGKLQGDFGINIISDTQVVLGFKTKYGTLISEGLEEKYDKKLWGLSKEDYVIIEQIIEAKIKKSLGNA